MPSCRFFWRCLAPDPQLDVGQGLARNSSDSSDPFMEKSFQEAQHCSPRGLLHSSPCLQHVKTAHCMLIVPVDKAFACKGWQHRVAALFRQARRHSTISWDAVPSRGRWPFVTAAWPRCFPSKPTTAVSVRKKRCIP